MVIVNTVKSLPQANKFLDKFKQILTTSRERTYITSACVIVYLNK